MSAIMRARSLERIFQGADGAALTALGPVDLEVREGEFLALVGPSGCGKSTLLHIMAGLDRPSGGDVEYRGARLAGPGPELGVVFQHYTTLPWLSVLDNVALGSKWRGLSRADRREHAARYVALVGLEGFEGAWPDTLSGGMRQRVAIARALAAEPALLFMDEPFGALDAQTRSRMQLELLRIWRQAGIAVLFVTHDIDEAAFLADRTVVLTPRPGRIFCEIASDVQRPRTLEVRAQGAFAAIRAQIAEALERATLQAVQPAQD